MGTLPFTAAEFIDVFVRYNQAIWPFQIVAYLLGITAVVLIARSFRASGRAVSLVLALFWIWVGAAYHLGFFQRINGAAIVFGLLFIVQGLLFGIAGGFRPHLTYRISRGLPGILGGVLIFYALVGYPVLGYFLGHVYPGSPVFGVAPCPLLIFTFGVLLWANSRIHWSLLIIPACWALVGLSAAISLGMREDFGLTISALLTIPLVIVRNRRLLPGAAS